MKTMLITGGAGFVGSSLALRFKQSNSALRVMALDNLRRRGSELILARLRQGGVEFIHGDVRIREDLMAVGPVDVILDCAAEPSVLAGTEGSPDYVVQTNLIGTTHVLELARRSAAAVLFLSTSRVYPVGRLNCLAFREGETRFLLEEEQGLPGASGAGVSEAFPLEGARSLYGASKLASELLLQEYQAAFSLRGIVNRCGVITGPWQMGKVDQGVVVLWAARHVYGGQLQYLGFEGSGKQVRDLLHVEDLYRLLEIQLGRLDELSGQTFNVGGGRDRSVSLLELTALCRRHTGREIPVEANPQGRLQDLRIFVTDTSKVESCTGWRPRCTPDQMVEEIVVWLQEHRGSLQQVLG